MILPLKKVTPVSIFNSYNLNVLVRYFSASVSINQAIKQSKILYPQKHKCTRMMSTLQTVNKHENLRIYIAMPPLQQYLIFTTTTK